jgi:hypothetical protein
MDGGDLRSLDGAGVNPLLVGGFTVALKHGSTLSVFLWRFPLYTTDSLMVNRVAQFHGRIFSFWRPALDKRFCGSSRRFGHFAYLLIVRQ